MMHRIGRDLKICKNMDNAKNADDGSDRYMINGRDLKM
jgi:hypothetical protein